MIVRAALVCLLLAASICSVAAMPRLPHQQLDVIAPSERIAGARGNMAVYQGQCRTGPTHWARRRIVDVAVQEWAFFGFQTIDATHVEQGALPQGVLPPAQNPALPDHVAHRVLRIGAFEDEPEVAATIAGYWSATPRGPDVIAKQNAAWNGPGGDASNWVEPWSAAFVSWVMCESGLGDMDQFARSIGHWRYVDQAIAARAEANPKSAYVAYDPGQQPIAPGDLLCSSRAGTDYATVEDRKPHMGDYAPMHCDIVVDLPADGSHVLAIGGNVLQSVTLTILPLVKDGAPYPHTLSGASVPGATTIFAHLKLRADAIEDAPLADTPTLKALRSDPGLAANGAPGFLNSPAP